MAGGLNSQDPKQYAPLYAQGGQQRSKKVYTQIWPAGDLFACRLNSGIQDTNSSVQWTKKHPKKSKQNTKAGLKDDSTAYIIGCLFSVLHEPQNRKTRHTNVLICCVSGCWLTDCMDMQPIAQFDRDRYMSRVG